jgi:hypothetical protein
VQITVGKRRKYSITLVFISWSYSRLVSIRIEFSDCYSQSSQILRICQKFLFWSFLGRFKDGHMCGVSTTLWGVYRVSMIAYFIRWCRFVAQTHNFRLPSLAMRLGIVVWPTIKYPYMFELSVRPLHQATIDGRVLPLWPWWESSNLYLLCRWWIILPKSYLDFSHPKPCRFTAWASLSNVVC